jgi:NADP-dependent 3-hydroxy acid dehydrogenase YdfG
MKSRARDIDSANSIRPKTMIVTGAGKGIGAGVTRAFLERGCAHNGKW